MNVKNPAIITKTVWVLSLVSLFTDIASEALYPVMPVFLKSIGFTVLWIGILEGMAEATAGLSKGYFGNLSDHIGRRMPFVRIGYILSALSKPLMAVSMLPIWIFFTRLLDRIGKGIRTAPRDAILSAESRPETKGRIFGLHRSLDTTGAVVGPVFALLYLYYYPQQYRTLFMVAFFPGLMAVLLTFFIKEKQSPNEYTQTINFFSFLRYLKDSPLMYKRLLVGLLFFTFINSTDLFLLLRAKEAGLSDTEVIGIYIFYNLIYAAFAYPAGILADRIGLLTMLIVGLILFAVVYAGMTLTGTIFWYGSLFLVYGLYAACSESIAKALISNSVDTTHMATALGTYNAFQSLITLVSSSLAGLVWYVYGAAYLFTGTASLTCIVICYFILHFRSLRSARH